MDVVVSDILLHDTAWGAEDLRASIARRLERLLPPAPDPSHLLSCSMRHALMAPGKRIRPLLTVLSARALGAETALALDAGCALEMVHTASLILDDLPCMDNAVLRRGQPSTHIAFGEDVAILAAISLLSRAFGIVAALPGLPPETRAGLVAILSEATGVHGLSQGQVNDLRAGMERAEAERVAAVNRLKTGVLFLAAVEMAALIAGASDSRRAALRVFAEHFGWAFQILDDLLDTLGTAESLGKDVGQDAGKPTMPALLGQDAATARLRTHVATALNSLAPLGEHCQPLRILLHATVTAGLSRL